MDETESMALQIVQEWALGRFPADHRFTAQDICETHRQWLGAIYSWAGQYRDLNIAKGGFPFAAANRIPRLMDEFERNTLRRHTPCAPEGAAYALAVVHAELILIHPFREGNGRLARLLALLMGYQAGLPTLDFVPMAGRGKRRYISAIHAALQRDYAPLAAVFERVIARALRRGA